jgi:hypothetical protein
MPASQKAAAGPGKRGSPPALAAETVGISPAARSAEKPAAWIGENPAAPYNCLKECRRLWLERVPVDRSALLHLMGEAYARLGDHERAARCYAGKAPE